MSADINQIAADVQEIKDMLQRLLSGQVVAPQQEKSTIIEAMEQATLLGLDPIKAIERFRVSKPRGRRRVQ